MTFLFCSYAGNIRALSVSFLHQHNHQACGSIILTSDKLIMIYKDVEM